jgi:hypothetical protein
VKPGSAHLLLRLTARPRPLSKCGFIGLKACAPTTRVLNSCSARRATASADALSQTLALLSEDQPCVAERGPAPPRPLPRPQMRVSNSCSARICALSNSLPRTSTTSALCPQTRDTVGMSQKRKMKRGVDTSPLILVLVSAWSWPWSPIRC